MNHLTLINTDGGLYADSGVGLCKTKDNFKRIYVLKSSNGNVKIGVSADVEKRKNYFKSVSGYEIVDYRFSKPCSNAFLIEKSVHKHFESCRLEGEWFSCGFEEALAYVECMFADFARFEEQEDHTVENLIALTGIDQIDDESGIETSMGEVSSLIKNVRITMERQDSAPRKIAKQTELLLRHFGIPVIEDFVEPTPWEQMELAE